MKSSEKVKKDTKKEYKLYTYVNGEDMDRVKKYVKDKFGQNNVDSSIVRIMITKMLSDLGY